MSQVGVVKILEGGVFYAKDSSGNIRELNIGDVILENEVVFGDSSNPTSAKVEMELSGNDVIVLNQAQQQLIDSSLNEVTFGNEEVTFTKNDIQNAWNNTTNDVSDDMETAAGDPTQQETQAGQEEPTEEGRVAARFSARDGNSTNVVSDLRDASWTEEQTTIIPDLEDKLIEQPLPIVFTVIDGDNVVWEGNTGTYTVKAVDAAGNPIIVNQDTIVYVRYTNIETDDNDTQYIHNTTIEVVIKAGTSEATFIVQTKDDYLADNGERFNLEITGNNSTEFDMRTGNQTGGQTNVDTTILDNSNPTTPGGEDNGFEAEDIVFAIIEGTATVNEGDTAQYVVKLVDKDGNPVTVTKDTEVTIKYTNKTTQDGDTQYKDNDTIKIIIKAGENSSDKFDVDTIDDYLADNGEKFNLEITNVDDQGQFEKVNIGDINGDKTNVDTTILDNTTDKPNENSTVESDQENVILKIVAVGEDGNPIIKDGKYTFENNVAEGSNAKYMVLAFKPGTTEFKTTDVVDTQGGTVTIKITDDTAKTTGTKDNAELDYVSETSKIVTVGEVFEIKTLDDYLSDDGEKYKVSINDKTYEHPVSGAIYENVVTNTDPVTTTIKDNTIPNTETNVEDVKIVLVAVSSATTTIADITNTTTGKLIIDNTNETPEGGKLYYIAVAVDKDGKPLATQGGDVIINYGTTSNTSDKNATTGVDYDNTTKVTTKVGEIFEVKTNDDYYAEGDENFTVKITDLENSPYETPSIDTTKDTVTSTIKDNAPTINGTVVSGGEDTDGNTYGAEDTVYAIITGETTVNEGGEVTYTVKLVDKDGNTVIPTKETTVTVTYTNIGTTSTDDTNKTNNQEIAVKIDASGKGTFTVETKDDYYAEADENYNVKITNVQNTGEFENVKFNSYPSTIPNNPSNNVTTTIKDNPSKVEQPDTGTGNDDPINGSYGKEDTVYVKIIGNVEVVEGEDLVHNIQLIDKDGKPVIIPDGEEITVTLTYTTNHDIKDSDFVNGSNQYNETTKTITVTIDKNTPKDENGIYKLPIMNKTIDDFTSEGNEVYILTITNVAQKDGKFENIAIGNPNGGEKSVTGTIKDGVTLGDPVDTTVYEDGLNNSATTENSLSNSLGITNPNNDEYKVSFDKSITTSTEKSNGQTITYSYNESGTILTAKRTDGKVVFTVELKKDASGKDVYDFQLKEAMDHEYGNNGKNDFDLSFKFSVTSNGMTSDNKTFNVTVVDSVPNAKDKTVTTNEDTATTIRLSNDAFKDNGTIKINGSDVAKGAEISIYEPSDTNKEHPIGKLLNNGDGTVKFTPSPDYSNYDFTKSPQFSYTVTDFDGDEATATVTVNVKPVADTPTVNVKDVTAYEDALMYDKKSTGNLFEGKSRIPLKLEVPELSKDQTDKNNATGDHSERNGEITLTFTNGDKVAGAKVAIIGLLDITTITTENQTLKVVIIKNGAVDYDYHHADVKIPDGYSIFNPPAGTVYLTKELYEQLTIQHTEDNDTDIAIKIGVTSYEVDDSGKPLNASDSTYTDKNNSNLSKTTDATMTVIIKPVTDKIELKFDTNIVKGETLGTITDSGKTFVYNDIEEGNQAIDLQALLSKTSGALNGFLGTKADLDGSEKRTYTISGIPEGTVVTLGGQTAVANKDGIATIVFNDTNNTKADPDFSMKFPENYSGTVNAKITLSVIDKGFKSDGKTPEDEVNWGEVKTAEVNFKVNVNPVADEATLKVGQAVGYEDAGRSQGNISNGSDASKVDQPEKGISLDIKVSSTDTDGSETITININKIPSGGYIYYKGGLYDENGFVSGTKTDGVISTKSGDTWTITVPEYNNESPKFIPPHNSDKEYQLEVTAQTVDTAMIEGTEVIKESDVSTPKIIEVIVKGVADVPVGTELNSKDGKAYTVGENNLDSSGNKFDLKVIYKDSSKLDSYDNDGSEELSIVIKGLPDGFSVEGALPTGDGEWAFNAKDLDKIKITTPSNFSGEASFTLTYVTTEREGNSKVHYPQDVNIYVNPEIDSKLNGQSVGNEDEVVTINLNLIHNNGDTDETLEEVKISVDDVTGKDFTLFIGGVDIKDAGLTIKDSYYVLTPAQAKTITAEGKENVSGDYNFKVKYTVKDVANDGKAEIKEFDATHNLVINPVTDQPTIDFGTIEVTGSNITVNGTDIKIVGDKKSTIEIPVETTSPDTDGSEKVVEIRIEGVPAGVKVVGGESSTEALEISQNNGVWTIKVDETITDINEIIKNIKFEIDSDAKFSHREITITTVTQDKNAETKEASKTITIDYDKAPGTGGGTGEAANFSLVAKDFIVTEDKEFRLTNLFDIKTNGGEVEGTSWTITLTDLPEGTIINGTVIGTDGKYVIESKLDGQDIYDIESIISSIKITPPANLNDYDNSTKSMTITATIETKVGQTVISTSEVENDSTILPVTDKMTVTVDAVNEIDESGSFEFGITLSSGGDKEIRTDIVGKTIVITVSENFESGETATGELLYNGQVLTPNANGQYEIEVPTGYKFGDKIEGLEYKSGEQRHGNVTIKASIKHQETEAHDNYETNVENASGSATVNVKPVLDANPDDIKITANSVEDTIIDVKIEDTQFITDNSENLINVIFNDIPKDFIVYYKDANGNTKMAVNTGDGKWLVPVVNGNLPDGIQIKAPENYSGEFKFNMDFYIKEEGLDLQKITKEATVNVTPIANGVTIDPTLSGIQDDGSYAKAFEWTDLNLNANMKDVDGSETLTLKFDGLSQNAQFRILAEDGTAKSVDALYENGEWTINGINVNDINNIQLLHDKEATVKVAASTVDTATDENGNPVGSSSTSTEVESTFDLRIDSSDIDNGKFTLGKEVNIDFSKIENGDIKDINTIDLGAEGKNELLNLTLDDVLSIGKKDGNGNINLTILGDDKDGVSFAKNDGWQKSEITQTIGDKTFEVWSNTGDNTVTVKVEQPISDGITN
ncbi:Ig-like domain-containing protein [Aliarcobacter butzleri]|uniref:Ig-like domain-containing protein n=1 Tax=Aliarcobacter butzleri TaxID=28197 RepID=UPI00344D9B9C